MTVLWALLSTTFIMTPLILLLLAFSRVWDKQFAAGGRCALWSFVMAGLCLPLIAVIHEPAVRIPLPLPVPQAVSAADIPARAASVRFGTQGGTSLSIIPGGFTHPTTPAPETTALTPMPALTAPAGNIPAADAGRRFVFPSVTWPSALLWIWVTGVIFTLLRQAVCHFSFKHYIKRWSAPAAHMETSALLTEEMLRLHIAAPVRLRRCKGINAPLLTGIFKPVILLPDMGLGYDDEYAAFILRHELTHLRHGHLWYKLVLTFVQCVYWFNPVVYLMAAQANKDMETVCDVYTVRGMDIQKRQRYSEMILSVAGGGSRMARSPLTTYASGGKSMLKQRFAHILGTRKNGVLLFIILGTLVFGAAVIIGLNFSAEENEKPFRFTLDFPVNTPAPIPTGRAAPGSHAALPAASWASYEDYGHAFDSYGLAALYAMVYEDIKIVEQDLTGVTALDIYTTDPNICITQGGDRFMLRYSEWMADEYRVAINDGRLEFETVRPLYTAPNGSRTDSWIMTIPRYTRYLPYTIEIVLPDGMELDRIDIRTENGNVSIAESVFNSADINTEYGHVEILGSSFLHANANTEHGRIIFQKNRFEDAAVNNENGNISIRDCHFNDVLASSVYGSSFITNSTFNTAFASAAYGDVYISLSEDIYNKYNLNADTDWGNIYINDKIMSAHHVAYENAGPQITTYSSDGSIYVKEI